MVLGTISDNMTQKLLYYVSFWPNASKNNVAMATPKIPGDQKLFERVCCMIKLKVAKFQRYRPDGL